MNEFTCVCGSSDTKVDNGLATVAAVTGVDVGNEGLKSSILIYTVI